MNEHQERVLDMEARRRAAPAVEDTALTAPTAPPWPALAPQALHGPLGELVALIEPHSEADTVALLAQSLVAFGSVIGRGPHFVAEADEHHANLFAALVGPTAKARKGSSWGHVRRVFAAVDPDWGEQHIQGGLSSGEGLIWAVRDAVEKAGDDGATVVVEPGVIDKRLLVLESELAQPLRVMTRTGNTLSPLLRLAWDGGRLQTLTKNSPAVATGAHISLVGHITADELVRLLGENEAGNGFGNRFLWLLVRRSKSLPWGGDLHPDALAPVVQRLMRAVWFARIQRRIEPDAEARVTWEAVYPELSEGKPGLLGSMVARAEAQAMRLALLYALADESPAIGRKHLLAALALWNYAEASAAYIFGDALGDPVADAIREALRAAGPAGMTRTDIREHFSRNRTAAEIERALGLLERQGLARGEKQPTEGPGRPSVIWALTAFTASGG